MDRTGRRGPTPAQARGRRWRQTSYGYHVPSSVDATVPEQRILEKHQLLDGDGAVTGWAGLRLRRGNFFDGLLPDGITLMPVPLCVPKHRRNQDGVRFLRDRLDPDEIVVIDGIRTVTAERATFDAMRLAPSLREAVVVLDMAAAAEITSIDRMRRYLVKRAGWKGVRRVRRALDLADENSRSPNETRMRLVWELDAGFPRPLVNQAVWTLQGRLLGYADLLDPVAGVVGEYDGADHRSATRHSADVDREGGFRDRHLEFFRVTGPDMRERRLVAARMVSVRSRAKWLPAADRTWTIEPPPGEQPELTLDQILEERDLVRSAHEEWLRAGEPGIAELLAEP